MLTLYHCADHPNASSGIYQSTTKHPIETQGTADAQLGPLGGDRLTRSGATATSRASYPPTSGRSCKSCPDVTDHALRTTFPVYVQWNGVAVWLRVSI